MLDACDTELLMVERASLVTTVFAPVGLFGPALANAPRPPQPTLNPSAQRGELATICRLNFSAKRNIAVARRTCTVVRRDGARVSNDHAPSCPERQPAFNVPCYPLEMIGNALVLCRKVDNDTCFH